MHAENDARKRNAEGEKDERKFEARIKISEHKRDGRCRHGVARGERKLVGWKDFGPAVGFDLARARTLAEVLESFEDEDASDRRQRGGADGGETLRASEKKKENCGRIPDPTVTEARGGQHPIADPAGRTPAIQAAHQTMIAALDETPYIACNGHVVTSLCCSNSETCKSKLACTAGQLEVGPTIAKSGFAQFRGVQIPKAARSRIGCVHELRPLLAEANFVYPVADCDCRKKNGQREHGNCPGRFAEHSADDSKNVGGDFGEAAVFAMNAAVPRAQAGEKFLDGAGAGNFRVGESDTGESVRIAACDADFSVRLCEALGFAICARPHLAVARFQGERVGSEPFEIGGFAAARQSGEHVIHAIENLTFGEVHQERYKIVTTLLNFNVIALGDAVDSQVKLGAAGHGAGNLFAEEEVGAVAEDFRGIDGVMVGNGDDGHAKALTAGVDRFSVIVGLIAEVPDDR